MKNFYMTNLKNKIFSDATHLISTVYVRYLDYCFLVVDSIGSLKEAFQQNSVLNFTYELGTNRQLNFYMHTWIVQGIILQHPYIQNRRMQALT